MPRSLEELKRDAARARAIVEAAERDAEYLEEELEKIESASLPPGAEAHAYGNAVRLTVRLVPGGEQSHVVVAEHPTPQSAQRHADEINRVLGLRWTELESAA